VRTFGVETCSPALSPLAVTALASLRQSPFPPFLLSGLVSIRDSLGLKIIYTLFVCALVPIYWRQYGPTNFLWFSDIALLALVPALWLGNALLVSMLAISVGFFEALWNIDFLFPPRGRQVINRVKRVYV
jgi:hypothetical protein